MFSNTNEASTAIFNKLKRHDKCDCCGKIKDVVTAASAFGGSYSYCMDCLNKGAEPYHAMVDYIACAGRFPDDINDTYYALVRMALEGLGVSVEQFRKDVDGAIANFWKPQEE